MHALDITVTLDTQDPVTFSAHALGVAARLAAWPGFVCASARVEATSRTFSGRYLVAGRRRTRSALAPELERLLRSAPSVTGIQVADQAPRAVGDDPGAAGSPPPDARSWRFDTVPLPRVPHAA